MQKLIHKGSCGIFCEKYIYLISGLSNLFGKLNVSQQNAIKDYHVATSFEAYFESNGKEIHNFNGGTATVTIDFTPEEGKNMDYYHMVHISDDGVMTRYKTRYTKGKLIFITPHFSDYAVIYD